VYWQTEAQFVVVCVSMGIGSVILSFSYNCAVHSTICSSVALTTIPCYVYYMLYGLPLTVLTYCYTMSDDITWHLLGSILKGLIGCCYNNMVNSLEFGG
jgi:hypothetical protein